LPLEEGVGQGRSYESESEDWAEQHSNTSGVSQTKCGYQNSTSSFILKASDVGMTIPNAPSPCIIEVHEILVHRGNTWNS